jgi:protein-S-isoprenylcysteine O-methyltransferase Ste14
VSWLPAFKIGLWNAWILILYVPLLSPIMRVVDKVVGTSEIYKKMGGDVQYQPGEKKAYSIYMVVLFVLLAYSIFLPLKLGTLWFYAGLTIYLVGLVMLLTSIVNVATTPLGKPFTRGIYRFSRHPGYFSMFITFLGASVASASWVFLLLSIVSIILQISSAIAEERACLEIFGAEYQGYLNRTPRWIGIPKSG